MFIAKAGANPELYEIFQVQNLKDINDKQVEIPVSIGGYALSTLISQRDELQEKIDAINLYTQSLEILPN